MTAALLLKPKASGGGGGGGGGDTIAVTSPMADARLLVGETFAIMISVTPGVSGFFDVLLSLDGGATFPISLFSDTAALDLDWLITSAHITATAVLRVIDSADALIFGDSAEFVVATTSAGGGGGLTADQQAQLNRIEAATAQIRGNALSWAGNVGPGGELQLTLGDDHETVIANSVPIAVKDPGGLLYARLTAGGVTLQWAAGQNKTAALITGTVTAVAFDSGTSVTTVTVEVPNCAALGDTMAPYTWQLQRTLGGRRKRELTGTLKLRQDMIGG